MIRKRKRKVGDILRHKDAPQQTLLWCQLSNDYSSPVLFGNCNGPMYNQVQ